MSSLGDPIRRRTTGQDLLRTVMNEILEIKNRQTAGIQIPKAAFIPTREIIYLSFSTPVVTTTTALTGKWDDAGSKYEDVVYI